MDERLLGAEPENIRNLPRRIWVESKKIWRVAFPAMLARVTQFGMFLIFLIIFSLTHGII